MQNKQSTLIPIGLLSLAILTYFFKKNNKQKRQHQQKIQQFKSVYEESQKYKNRQLFDILIKNPNSSSLSSNLKQTQLKQSTQKPASLTTNKLPNQKLVCFKNIKPQYNPSTFRLFQRQRSLFDQSKQLIPSTILENQMGGDFTFKRDQYKIRCKLNDFNLSTTLLQQQKQDIHIFKNKNHIQPLVCSIMTTLKPAMLLSIFGKLYYDQNKFEWSIQPIFLTQTSEIKRLVEQFYSSKKSVNSLYNFAILVGGLMIAYFTLFKPIRSLYRKLTDNHKDRIYENQIDFFKNKENILVKGSSLLNCEICNQKSVQIVYQCGHLSLCIECHEHNLEKLCPLCKKKSMKFMKIYMA